MRKGEDEVAERFHGFVFLQFLVKFFDEELAKFLRTFADFENTGQNALTGCEPLVVIGTLSINQNIYLSNEEVFSELTDFRLIYADNFGNFLDNVKIRLSILNVSFEHVEKRLEILFFDERSIFRESNAQYGYYGPLFSSVGLLSFVSNENIPHMCKGLRFDDYYTLTDWFFDDGLQYLLKSWLILRDGLCEKCYELLGNFLGFVVQVQIDEVS